MHKHMRFQRFQHCKVSPKLPVLPTNPAGSLPSAEARTPKQRQRCTYVI